MTDRWLYQGIAEPPPAAVLPAAETITVDKWYRQAQDPVRLERRRPSPSVFAPIDPSVYPIPGDGAWLQPTGRPVVAVPFTPPDGFSFVANPSDLVTDIITLDKWYQPASEPVRPRQPADPGFWAGVTEPTLFVVPGLDTWFRPTEQPVQTVPPRPHGGAHYQADPSVFVEPTGSAAIYYYLMMGGGN